MSIIQDSWITLGVDSKAAKYSPGNWKGDCGRGGGRYRQSWNNGAWFSFTWQAAPLNPMAVVLLGVPGTSNRLCCFLNGILRDDIPANADFALTGILPGAVNTVVIYLRSSWQNSRWNDGRNVVRSFGLKIDLGSSAGEAPAARRWALVIGDSITEGIQARDGADHFLYCYSFHLERALDLLGFDTGISACGYSGWLQPGDADADVPPYFTVRESSDGFGGRCDSARSRWNRIDENVSLLDAEGHISAYGAIHSPPSIILINYMTNDVIAGSSLLDLQAAIAQGVAALRGSAPHALIVLLVPFGIHNATIYPKGGEYRDVLGAAIRAYRTAHPADKGVIVKDFGLTVSNTLTHGIFANPGGVHPSSAGHALAGSMVAAFCASLFRVQDPQAIPDSSRERG